MSSFAIYSKESAPEASQKLLAGVEKKYGFVPNLLGSLAESPAALQAYLGVAGAYSTSTLSPLEQQVVLVAISSQNNCDYCVAAHGMMLKGSGGDDRILDALKEGRALDDEKLEALRSFALAVLDKSGWVSESVVQTFKDAGFTQANVLEVITGIAMKTLSNYTNHILNIPIDDQFQQ